METRSEDQALCLENETAEHILQTCPIYIQHDEEDSLANGDPQCRPSSVPRERDSGAHPADMPHLHTTRRRRHTGQWRPAMQTKLCA